MLLNSGCIGKLNQNELFLNGIATELNIAGTRLIVLKLDSNIDLVIIL